MRPADILLTVLREEGITRVFGNPGTTELPFLDAVVDAPDLEYVLGVHEGTVVAMADGYARATRRPAFVSLHVAAGLANGLTGLLNASRSRTPLVVTAGQQDRRHLAQDPMLTGDLVGLARPAVKHAFDVRHTHDLPTALRRAFALAVRPPAGPVFLSIPMDLLAEDTDLDLPARTRPAPPGAAGGTEAAADLLAGAARPALVAGDGVGRDGAVPELVAVAEALGATVFHQPLHDRIDFPGTHPLYAGALTPTNAAIREALAPHDAVLIAGCHAFMPHHYTPGPAIPESTTVAQLDTDPAEVGRNFAVAAPMVGDLAASLAELARRLRGRVPEAARRTEEAGRRHAERRAAYRTAAYASAGAAPMDPLSLGLAVADSLPEEAVLLEEAITTGVALRPLLRLDRPDSFVHTVGGGLGSGIGMAVGTALGHPGRPVVAVLGDGCALFGLQGLWNAARHRAPVTFVVANNGEYRTLKETLDTWGSRATATRHYPGLDLAPPHLDFTGAAAFFGVDALRVTDRDELAKVVAGAAHRDGPLLVDVPVLGHTPPA
ncbi:thiamine pyrophosphate-binding protein [Streptomyces sp. NPDC003691]